MQISAGLDVLFHSMESYTAIPCVVFQSGCLLLYIVLLLLRRYTERTPRPSNPILRPAYQGSNPVADIFSLWALQTTVANLPRIAKNPDDGEARRQMLYVKTILHIYNLIVSQRSNRLASSFAGIGFGNAGVHLCHGMSYPVSRYALI